MAVRQVLSLPDPRLKRVASRAASAGQIDDAASALAVDLLDTMRVSPACVGLAATQIGVALRAVAVDVSGHRKARSCHGEFVLFDPELVDASGSALAREGCMSVPSLTGDVIRHETVVVRGVSPDGEERVIAADAFEARAIQHELDHLDGLLFLDRVSSSDSVFRRKVYR
jgi:peptide deformylase